jgi:hypothetical protein
VRLLAPLLAAVALAASACGGDTVSLDPVARAADTTASQSSEHVELTASATGADGTRISMSGSGDFQNNPQLGEMTLSFTSSRGSGSFREVVKDWTVYMTSSLFAGQLPDGKTWMSLDVKKAGNAAGIDLTTFSGQSPGQALQQLKASANVVRVGPTAIDGVTTTHYRAIVDLSKVPDGNKIAQLTHVEYEPVDVWIARDGLVRRMRLGYTVPAGSPGAGSVEMTMDLSRYGEPVYVSVPDASQTYDATAAAKNALRH